MEADDAALEGGRDPGSRTFGVGSEIMRKLGYSTFALGRDAPPLLQRIYALHSSLYRKSDLQIGAPHGGIFMFRDVFARLTVPYAHGRVHIDPLTLTDLNENQLRWLVSRPHDYHCFLDQFWDVFDFGAPLGRYADFANLGPEAAPVFRLAGFQLQAAAAALSVAFDWQGAIQSALIGAELALKAALAAKGWDDVARRRLGHNLTEAADAISALSPAFDAKLVRATVARMPSYVANRYSIEQPGRRETGRIVMDAQFIAAEAMRSVTGRASRSDPGYVAKRAYPDIEAV